MTYKLQESLSYNREENVRFLNQASNVLKIQKQPNPFLCGDFNVGELNWITHEIVATRDDVSQKVYNLIQDNFCTSHVTEPTRRRGSHNPSTLDLIITKSELEIENLEHAPPLGASDHNVLSFEFVTENQENCLDICQLKFNCWKGNYIELDKFFCECDWDSSLNDRDIYAAERKFLELYLKRVNKFIPKIKYQINSIKNRHKWLDRDCVLLISKKKIAWNRYRRRKTTQRYEHYCKIRNVVTTKIREAKRKFEKSISKEAKKNPQAIFGYMRSKMKIREEVTRLKKYDRNFINNDKENCEVLNDKFQSAFVTEPEGQLPKLDYVFVGWAPTSHWIWYRWS